MDNPEITMPKENVGELAKLIREMVLQGIAFTVKLHAGLWIITVTGA